MINKIFCIAIACCTLSSCTPGGPVRAPGNLDTDGVPKGKVITVQVQDIPVPRDFIWNEKDSWYGEVGPTRRAELKYHGRSSIGEAIQFYLDTMPALNWKFHGRKETRMGIHLFFTKGPDVARVTISRALSSTSIIIVLDAKQQSYGIDIHSEKH